MKNTKLAVAVGAGYLLGRMHKVRWAVALAGLAAGKRLTAGGGDLVGGLMESSPQLRELADTVKGELADAGKKAAVAAAGRKMEALTDRLESGTSALRDGTWGQNRDKSRRSEEDGESEEPEEPEDSEEPEEAEEPEEQEEADEAEEQEEHDEGSRPSGRRSRTAAKTAPDRSRSRQPAKAAAKSRPPAAKKTAAAKKAAAKKTAPAKKASATKKSAAAKKATSAARRSTGSRRDSARKRG